MGPARPLPGMDLYWWTWFDCFDHDGRFGGHHGTLFGDPKIDGSLKPLLTMINHDLVIYGKISMNHDMYQPKR